MMNILLIAPQPFYVERGTPIAVDLLSRALADQGNSVDLLTFSPGKDRPYKNVNHIRLRQWFGIDKVKPGFSLQKLVLDFFLFFRLLQLLCKKRYQVVHAVEESVYMAMIMAPIFRFRYVYDMDSSMAGQIVDRLPRSLGFLAPVLNFFESLPLRYASVVVPVCDALAVIAAKYRKEGVFLLKDVSLVDKSASHSDVLQVSEVVNSTSPVFMYVGNLEPYQGVGLMLDAFALFRKAQGNASLVIIGGEKDHIDSYKRQALVLGVDKDVYFTGPQPVDHLYELTQQAAVLISPRTEGVNTPMKVYSYMDSGVPVLATNLPTHTQVMSEREACLVAPTPEAMANGMEQLFSDPEYGKSLAANASELIREHHSVEAFRNQVGKIYGYLGA